VGRQDDACNRKKCKHGRLHFFLPYSQQLRLLAAPSPLSLLIVGLLPVPELTDFGMNKNKATASLPYGFCVKAGVVAVCMT
jgi:hypothetical protein